jgi:uncharacterized membrane protein YphA (DoxX/SURF4 family)
MKTLHEMLTAPVVAWLGLLWLCSAYLQGGFDKLRDFEGAVAEMRSFGLAPAAPWAVCIILLELAAPVLVLTGWYRWAGALALGGFTLLANLLAGRWWTVPPRERQRFRNAFFEHWGLVGAFLLVAWFDLGGAHVG